MRYYLSLSLPIFVTIFLSLSWPTSMLAFFCFYSLLIALDTFLSKEISYTKREDANKIRYKYLLYLHFVFFIGNLFYFSYLTSMTLSQDHWYINLFRSMLLGFQIGFCVIPVAHELGHRKNTFNHIISQLMLSLVMYAHFYVYHNMSHHKNVGTIDDPTTAKKGESFYHYFFRVIYKEIAISFRIDPLMTSLHFFGEILILILMSFYDYFALFYYFVALFFSQLIFQAMNYIQHYGLSEKVNKSWDSENLLTRILLFELSIHNDHHNNEKLPFQVVRKRSRVPTLSHGYFLNFLMLLIPPLWTSLMNEALSKLENESKEETND